MQTHFLRQNFIKTVRVEIRFGLPDGSEAVRVAYLPKETLDRMPKTLLSKPNNAAFTYCRIYTAKTKKLISEAYK